MAAPTNRHTAFSAATSNTVIAAAKSGFRVVLVGWFDAPAVSGVISFEGGTTANAISGEMTIATTVPAGQALEGGLGATPDDEGLTLGVASGTHSGYVVWRYARNAG